MSLSHPLLSVERAGAAEGKKLVRIMVVDDNPAVRRYLRGVLEQQEGWKVCDEARNGQEAVERFSQIHPDLLLLDFQMPDMNGLDASRAINKTSPDTPILLVTLYLSKHLTDEAKKVGIRGACAKTDISSVVEAVGALLAGKTYFRD